MISGTNIRLDMEESSSNSAQVDRAFYKADLRTVHGATIPCDAILVQSAAVLLLVLVA